MSATYRLVRLLGGFSAGLLLIGNAAWAEPAAIVKMTDHMQFSPAIVTIRAGATVAWKNVSKLVHTVTDVPNRAVKPADASLPADAKAFNSGYIAPGRSYRHTFTVPGSYHYFCIPHEADGMVGEVKVLPR